MRLGLDFLSVFEGDPDALIAVDSDEVHQLQPCVRRENGERLWHRLKGCDEGFNVSTLGLTFLNFLHHVIQPGFCFFKALAQAVEAFLVFGLVKGNVGIVVNALLHHIGNHLRFFQQLVLLLRQGRSVEEHGKHGQRIGDDAVLGSQQLVGSGEEAVLNVLIRQVRRLAMLVVIELVIALPDGLAVFAVGMPYL